MTGLSRDNPERLKECFKETWPDIQARIDDMGAHPFSGDCASFARAMQKEFDGEVWCSFTHESAVLHGEPAHCALKCGDTFIDADGETTRAALIENAVPPQHPHGPSPDEMREDAVFTEAQGEGFCHIEDKKLIGDLREVFREETQGC